MIPLAFLERSLRLMENDAAVTAMLSRLVHAAKNPLVNGPVRLDPRIFNAHTFGRIAARAKITGDADLADFMEHFAAARRLIDQEQEAVEEAEKAGRVISTEAVAELARALGIQTDDELLALRIRGHRLSPLLDRAAFALIHVREHA